MRKDCFYFAELDLRMINENRDLIGLEDSILVLCQQMIEKILRGLLAEKYGEVCKTHSVLKLMREYDSSVKEYDELLRTLTNCYYDRRYETDYYIEYSREEYEDLVNKTLELRELLIKRRKVT